MTIAGPGEGGAELSAVLAAHLTVFGRQSGAVILMGGVAGIRRALTGCRRFGFPESALRCLVTDSGDSEIDGVSARPVVVNESGAVRPLDAAAFEYSAGQEAGGQGAVLLVDSDLTQMLRCHQACQAVKDRGLPVVPVFERTPFLRPPVRPAIGLGYEGMFDFAGRFARSLRVPGDYLEFGVFDGRTMTLAWHTLAQMVPGLRLIGFDTFRGIRGGSADETAKFPDGAYYANRATFDHTLAVAGVDPGRVMVVEGDMIETLADPPGLHARLGLTRCLVAHLDCDVSAAALAALRFLTPVIDRGTLLLFDEYDQWGGDPERGERRALRQWLIETPQFTVEPYRSYLWCARSFIVQRA